MKRALALLLFLALADPAAATIVTPHVVLTDPTADLQAAINATPSGGLLRLSTGVYVAPTDSGWAIRRPITIEGEGVGSADTDDWGTIMRPYGGDDTSTVRPTACGFRIIGTGGVVIRNLTIANKIPPTSASSYDSIGAGILVDNADNTAAVHGFTLENVNVSHMGGWGVVLDGGDGSLDRSINSSRIYGCDLALNQLGGIKVIRCYAPSVAETYSHSNYLYGMWLVEASLPRVLNCAFETNQANSTDSTYQAQVRVDSGHSGEFIGDNFESFYADTNRTALTLNNCYGTVIEGCNFANGDSVLNTCSIRLVSNSRGIRIGPNTHSFVTYAVYGGGPSVADTTAADEGIEGVYVEQQNIMHRTISTSGPTFCPGEVSIPSAHNTYNLMFGRLATQAHRIYGLRLPTVRGIDADVKNVAGYSDGFITVNEATGKLVYYFNGEWWELDATKMSPQP